MSASSVTRANRWQTSVLALAVLGAALAFRSATLAIAAVVPVIFFAYGRLARATDRTIRVERTVTPNTPAPGESVTVELEISTPDDRPIPDLRIVDGVPAELAVVEGSPRTHTALTDDGTATVTYDVRAKRGDFEFETPEAEIRPVSAAFAHSPDVELTGVETLSCRLLLEDLPLHDQTVHFVGQVQTDVGGDGVEFHSTREYRRGDPLSRIDWRRYARGGGLTTVEFREEQATPVVFLLDVRTPTQVARGPGYPTALDLCLYGAERGTLALIENGNTVGLSLFGADGWVEPSGTQAVRDEVSATLDQVESRAADGGTNQAASSEKFDPETAIRRLEQRLPVGAQVVFWTPVLDDVPVRAVRRLMAEQVPVTVVSPDVARGGSPGRRIAALERETRLRTMRGLGARVVDWNTDEPVAVALERAIDADESGGRFR